MSGISKRVSGSWVSGDYGIMKTATDIITTLPADLYADGTNATVGISGNMSQSGTPTPQNPIQPQGTGEKTGNLFDGQLQQGYYTYHNGLYVLSDAYVCTHLIPCTENTTYTFRCINTGGGSKNYGYVFFDSTQNRIGDDYINAFTEGDVVTHTATTPQNTAFLAINIAYGRRQASVVRPSDITDFMLNTGSTALPYEPYGYKIPISSGGVTTNIYLGSTQTVRAIKKVVFDGSEDWQGTDDTVSKYLFIWNYDYKVESGVTCMSTHYSGANNIVSGDNIPNNSACFYKGDSPRVLYLKGSEPITLADFKAYLAQQYANGTPVTVWYVLATATTGIVNEPLMRVGDYADTVSGITIPTTAGADSFDVLTTLKPSEVTVNYKGWHPVADVHERENGAWD